MDKVLGTRLLFSFSLVAAVAVWAACGGSDDAEVLGTPDAGFDAGNEEEEEDEDSGTLQEEPDTGPKKVYDAGAETFLDGGDEFEGGIPCVVGGLLEEEPNDDPAEANELPNTGALPSILSRCGVVVVKDGGADGGDTDWLKFELTDASTSFYVQYAGDVTVHVETDGQAPFDITSQTGEIRMFRGQPYYAKVRAKNGKTSTWRVSVFQE